MEPNAQNGIKKTVIMISMLLLVVAGAYFFIFHKGVPETVLDQYGNPIEAQTVGSDLVTLLDTLQQVTLNDAIFSKEPFIRLTDFSTTLPVEQQGRQNPFGSLSGGAVRGR